MPIKRKNTWGGSRKGSGSRPRLESVGSRFTLTPLNTAGPVKEMAVIEKRKDGSVVRDQYGQEFLLSRAAGDL